MVYLLAFLMVLDLALTDVARRRFPGFKEHNPIARWLVEKTDSVWVAGLLLKTPVFALVYLSKDLPLITACVAVYVLVVLHGFYQLRNQ